jgi:hypothetical protein
MRILFVDVDRAFGRIRLSSKFLRVLLEEITGIVKRAVCFSGKPALLKFPSSSFAGTRLS